MYIARYERTQTISIERGGRTFKVTRIDIGPSTGYCWQDGQRVGWTTEHDLGIFGHMALLLRNETPRSYLIEAAPTPEQAPAVVHIREVDMTGKRPA